MFREYQAIAMLALIPVLAYAQPTFQTIFQFGAGYYVGLPPTEVATGVYVDGGAFQLTPPAEAGAQWTLTNLGVSGGTSPMLPAPGGGFYVTESGNSQSYGEVDLISPPPATGGAWTQSTLYIFSGAPDGAYPGGNLVLGQDGSIYGGTAGGGAFDQGTAFQLIPPSTPGGAWTEAVIYSFAGPPGDGTGAASLTAAVDGSLYGTSGGGAGVCWGGFACGVVFHLSPPTTPGGAWQESLLYEFQNNADGFFPDSLSLSPNGTLYGTTVDGGLGRSVGSGLAFSLAPPSSPGGAWTKSTICEFKLGTGVHPNALVLASDGNLYGTALTGGAACEGSKHVCGTVFELIPPARSGGKWTEKTVHAFAGKKKQDGMSPIGLTSGTDGNLYGATKEGGTGNGATVFQVIP